MKKIYLIIILISFTATSKIMAQYNMMSIQYSIGYTSGDFNDFISKPSFRGMSFDYHNLVTETIGVGFEIGWNNFYDERNYETYTRGSASLTGKQYRYCFAVPILVSANYYLGPGEVVNPYIGFGIGGQYTHNDVDMGLYSARDEAFHFAIKPEIGIILKPGADVGIVISGKFYDVLQTKDIGKRSFFTSNIGLIWEY
jgi:opacity protein-like surface antigen